MNHKQRIFNMLAKAGKPQATQLSRKVKFAFADDAESAAGDLRSALDEVRTVTEAVEGNIQDVISSLDEALGLAPGLDADMIQETLDLYNEKFEQANKVADEFKNAAEQLGIDPYDSPAFKALVESIEAGAQDTFKLLIARDNVTKYAEILTTLQSNM